MLEEADRGTGDQFGDKASGLIEGEHGGGESDHVAFLYGQLLFGLVVNNELSVADFGVPASSSLMRGTNSWYGGRLTGEQRFDLGEGDDEKIGGIVFCPGDDDKEVVTMLGSQFFDLVFLDSEPVIGIGACLSDVVSLDEVLSISEGEIFGFHGWHLFYGWCLVIRCCCQE